MCNQRELHGFLTQNEKDCSSNVVVLILEQENVYRIS